MSLITCTKFDESSKTWSGYQRRTYLNQNINVGQVILDILERSPNKITQISDDTGVKVNCEQMRSRSLHLAQNLKRLGYKRNDVICIAAKNTEYIGCVAFACFLINAPISTVDPFFNHNDMAHMMSITKPKLIFCDKDNYDVVRKAIEITNMHSEIIVAGNGSKNLFEQADADDFHLDDDGIDYAKETAVILCTSGTTGPQKGACLSHSHVLEQLGMMWHLLENDVLFCFSSLYWLTGFGSLIYGTIAGAMRIITTKPFTPEYLLELIQKHKITDMVLPPVFLDQMLKSPYLEDYDISTMKKCLVGGSTVSDTLKKRMQAHLRECEVMIVYALTENAGIVSLCLNKDKPGCVGKLTPRTKIKIVADDDSHLGIGAIGEICVKTESKFLGYFENTKATFQTIDGHGWIHTGDVGYFDEDGYLFLIDRVKDIIKYNGYQIWPSELEELIRKCEGVQQACVVGVKTETNDLPAVIVVKVKESNIKPDDVVHYVNKRVVEFKQIRAGCYFVDKLPMTNTGKVQKKQIKAMATNFYNNFILNQD